MKPFAEIIGNNIVRSGDVITLDFEEVEYIRQPFGTRVENVTPFLVTFYAGAVALVPETDVWIDTQTLEPHNVEFENDLFDSMVAATGAEVTSDADGNRTGVSPIIWDSWETTGVNVDQELDVNISTNQIGSDSDIDNDTNTSGNTTSTTTTTTTTTEFETEVSVGSEITTSLDQQRTGQQITINETTQTESLGESIVDREIIHFLRARNIETTGQE